MIEFGAFLTALTGSPVLVVVLLLTLGATVVNGATDAPNAIATVVGTRSMPPGAAIIMAAICTGDASRPPCPKLKFASWPLWASSPADGSFPASACSAPATGKFRGR